MNRLAYAWIAACVVVMCVLSAGCSVNEPFHGEPTFDDLEITFPRGTREEILQGCRAWMVEGVHCDVSDAPTITVEENWDDCDGDHTEGQIVQATDGTWHVTVFLGCDFEHLVHTAAHEVGHSLGIGHIGDGNLMTHSRTFGADFVTVEDHLALQAVAR